jgi:hypothetical protein
MVEGSGGMPGSGGTPGSGGIVGLNCAAPASLASGLVTDFAAYNTATARWGPPGGLTGQHFAYAGPMNATPASTASTAVDTTAGNMRFMATVQPGGYAGMGLVFDACVDVSRFNAARFTISGTLGGCALELQIQTYSERPSTDAPAGGCTATPCYEFPRRSGLAAPGATPMTVSFTLLSPWTAATAAEVVGIQWQATVPTGAGACTVDLRLDDIAFVME